MRKQKRRYVKELRAAQVVIRKLMSDDYGIACEFCKYEADMNKPCTNGDKEWCQNNATWKGLPK